MKKILIVLGVLFLGIGLQAQTCNGKLKRSKTVQNKKIRHGVNHGTLNVREVRNIKQSQRQVNRAVQRAKGDGVVTRNEKARIAAKNQRVNRKIRRAKAS